jgi:hypothetical protein
MARNERRRQKALKRKHRRQSARRTPAGGGLAPPGSSYWAAVKVIKAARSYPIHECLINPSWHEKGMASILLSRRQPDGLLLFGCYLVDVLCLGLKNTFCNANLSRRRYETEVKAGAYRDEAPVVCFLPLAHEIIYGGIEYAASLGFRPEKDFKLSRYILEEREALDERPYVEFGRDGKPLYISGPQDHPERILRQLESRVGPGNYHFLLGGPVGPGLEPPPSELSW